jgi:hypothetical protein
MLLASFADRWFFEPQCLHFPGVEIEPVEYHYAGAMTAVSAAALDLQDMTPKDAVQLRVASQIHEHRTPRFCQERWIIASQ